MLKYENIKTGCYPSASTTCTDFKKTIVLQRLLRECSSDRKVNELVYCRDFVMSATYDLNDHVRLLLPICVFMQFELIPTEKIRRLINKRE